jgi:hypothetical protein
MGLLSGLAFALFYTTLGVPLARLADRNNRVKIMAVSLLALERIHRPDRFAKTFVHLLIARVGVAVGEAGCNPAAYSLIGDYFEARRRATALSIFQMGGYIGSFLGLLLGGWVGHHLRLARGVSARRTAGHWRGVADEAHAARTATRLFRSGPCRSRATAGGESSARPAGEDLLRAPGVRRSPAQLRGLWRRQLVRGIPMRSHGMNVAKAGTISRSAR